MLRLQRELEGALLESGALLLTNVAEEHDFELSLQIEFGDAGDLQAVDLEADTGSQRIALAQVTQRDWRVSARGIAQLLVKRLDQDPGIAAFLAQRRAQSGASAPALLAAPTLSAFLTGAPQPTAYVVAVGVEHYADLPPPTGASLDAQRFAALASTSLGVPEDHVHLLLDQQATRATLDKELAWLIDSVPAGGRIYFYFGGHGAPDPSDGSAYLVPYDGDPKYLSTTALSVAQVAARLSRSQAREAIVLLDSCFSGTGGRSVLASGVRPLVTVKTQPATAQVAVLSAASGSEISGAAMGGQGGLFTTVLLEGLGSGKADQDGNGQISLRELADWLTPRVERAAKKDGREQTPSLQLGPALGSAENVIMEWGLPEQ